MFKNWSTMVLALALAIFTWFLVTGREVVETWLEMPVVMTNPPEGMIIEDGLVDKIQVRLRGPRGLVDSLASQHLTYPLNVSSLKVGQQVLEIDPDRLPLTSSYEVIEIKPNRLKLLVDKRISKKIKMESAWAGKLNPDYELIEVKAEPPLVEIRGPATKLRKVDNAKVVLEEDFPDKVPDQWAEDVAVGLDDEIEASPAQVRVVARFAPRMRDIWVKLPLGVLEPEGFSVSVNQDYVRLHIEGPVFLFRTNEYRKKMQASLRFGGKPATGTFDLEYDVVLPEGCHLLKRNPETVRTAIKKK